MALGTKTTPVPTPIIRAAAPAVPKQAIPAIKPVAPRGVAPLSIPTKTPPVPPQTAAPAAANPADDAAWLQQVSRPLPPERTGSPSLDAARDADWLAAASRSAGVPADFDTGALNTNPETIRHNEAVQRTGIGEPVAGTLPGTLSARDSHLVTARELAGVTSAGQAIRDNVANIERETADLERRLNAINRYVAQNPVAAREMTTFGNIISRPMTAAEAMQTLQASITDNRNQIEQANGELAANAASRDELLGRLFRGDTRQTAGAAAFNAGLAALAQTGTETLRGIGIAVDAVENALTGDTTDNALVRSMDAAKDYMNRVLPVDRAGFFSDLASGAGSFAGFMVGGLTARALSGGSRLLQNLAIGTLGGAQQGAQSADLAMEGTIGQEIARLQSSNEGGINDEQIAALQDALAITRYKAFAAGFGVGATELIPLDRIIMRANEATGGAFFQRLRNAASGGVEEAAQELGQNVLADAVQQGIADPEHPIDWEGAGGAAVIAFLLGAGAGGVLVNVDGRQVTVEQLAAAQGIPPATAPGAAGPSAPVTPPPEGVPEGAVPADTLYPAPETVAPGAEPPPAAGGAGPVVAPDAAILPAGPSPAVSPAAAAPAAVPQVANPAAPVIGGEPAGGTPGANNVGPVGAGVGAGAVQQPVAQPQGIPFVVTQHQRAQLGALGMTPEQIRAMTPAEVQAAIAAGRRIGPATPPADDAAWLAAITKPVTPGAPNAAATPVVDDAGPPAAGLLPGQEPDARAVSPGGQLPNEQPDAGAAGLGPVQGSAALPTGGDVAGVRLETAAAGLVSKLPARGRSEDLLQFIASKGGIRPTPELVAMDAPGKFIPGRGKFVRPTGRDADRIREAVAEAGYFGTGDRTRAVEETTVDDLYQLIDRALRGERITPDDAEDMGVEGDALLSAEHEKYLDRIEGELLAWSQEYDIEDRPWLRAMVKVADEVGLHHGFTAEEFEAVMTQAAMLLADRKIRKAVADEIPFDLHPEDARAAAAGAGPRNAAPSGGEVVSVGRPGDGQAAPAGGGGQGQAPERVGAAAEDTGGADRVVATFKTAKGSTYQVHADGTTTRNKAARDDVGHEGDSGPKPRSSRTVYVDGTAAHLSAAGLQNLGPKGARVTIIGDRAILLTWNDKANGWGSSDRSGTPFFTEPAVGRSPLELWKPADDVPGREAYRGMHAGNAITELTPVSKPRPAVDQTDAGAQLVLPGAEKINDAEHAQLLANKPLRPTVDQKPADDGLFGDSAAQTDLVDLAKQPTKEKIPTPDLIAESQPLGENAAGEPLYENGRGRFRVRHDRKDREPEGYPDFGGDLAPTAAAVSEKFVPADYAFFMANRGEAPAAQAEAAPAAGVEMTADVEGVTFHETPPPRGETAYYIATGEKGAMYTLRIIRQTGQVDPHRFVVNLSRDKQDAIRKAKHYAKERGLTAVYWGAPEELNDIEVGAGGSGSSGSKVDMPTEMVDPITAAGLKVKPLVARSGKTYWAATGDLKKHEAILDQLGFAPLRKINGVWQRSYFTSDPTAALAEALTTGRVPLKDSSAPLPMKTEAPAAASEPAIDPEVAKAILAKAKIVVSQDARGGFVVTGKTFDIKDQIKAAGGIFASAVKGWRFTNDPTQKLAAIVGANAGANAGTDGAGDARIGIDPAEDARLRAAREREDARADERVADASRLVSDESKELIRRGLKFGIPKKVVDEQIEDVGMIVNARERGKPMFLLANEAGTGKTFVMGAAIRDLRNRGQKRFIYVTQSQDLIAQIQRDLAPYGLEGVEFATYSKMPDDAKGAALFFDETHNIKNLAGSQRGKNGADLISQADFTVFASATPFQNPVEAKYLEATGIYGKHDDAHNEWAKMYGAAVRRRTFYNPKTRREQVEEIVYWPGRGKKKDGAAARQWFFKQGVMTQRAMQIDPGMVDVAFTRAPVAEQYVKLYKDIDAAYETVMRRWTDEAGNSRDQKITSEVARHRETTIKRVLEAAKGPAAISRAKEIIAEGKNVVLFVETKAERTIGKFRKSEHFKEDTLYAFPEMQKLMEAWAREAEAARRMDERPPPQPFASFIYEIARGFHDHGILHELPSVADDFMEAMGGKEKVAVYTGAVAQAAARKNKEEFLSGKKKVLVATMAKGGTGLSLHDTVGNRETVQLNINLPWAAWQVDQVSARVARYGLKSKARIEWLFASNIDWETTKLAPRVGARMADMGAIVKGLEVKAAEKLLGDFDFEGEIDVKQAAGGEIALDATDGYTAEDDIYANAARLERGRVKASDTTGGFFETPYPLAALMTRVAGIRPGEKVLEPSAGTGNLLEFAPTDAKVTAIEVRRDNLDKLNERLRRRGYTDRRTFNQDFIEWSELPAMVPGGKEFDVVLMNPPFERESGVGALDVAHVERAYGLLKPGGRLVAIMGEGPFFRQTKQEANFREWLDDVGATVIKLPENAFKKSGTGVRARMVVIDKDRPGGRSTIDLADMENASLRGIELTVPPRQSGGMGMMEEWDRLGLGGMAERDKKDTRTGWLFGSKPVAPPKQRATPEIIPELGPLDEHGHFDLGPYDARGLPLGQSAQEYVLANGRHHGREFLVAFDQDGKTVVHGHGGPSGTGDTIAFNMALNDPSKRIVSHHNHPSGQSFSRADITFLGFVGHVEMWAHGHNGAVYRASLTREARGAFGLRMLVPGDHRRGDVRRAPASFHILAAAYDAALDEIRDVMKALFWSGKITGDHANDLTHHYIKVALHKAGIIDYGFNISVDPASTKGFEKGQIERMLMAAAVAAQNKVFTNVAAPSVRIAPAGWPDRGTGTDYGNPGGVGVALGLPAGSALRLGSASFGRLRTAGDSAAQGGDAGEGLNQPVWHGSGTKGIRKFLTQFLGTGEGHHSFGWGFYAAKAEGTGKHYRLTIGGYPYYEIPGLTPEIRRNASMYSGELRAELEKIVENLGLRAAAEEVARSPSYDGRHPSADGLAKVLPFTLLKVARDASPEHGGFTAYAHSKEMLAKQWEQEGRFYGDVYERRLEAAVARALIPIAKTVRPGALYKLEIPDDDVMLDYDRPFADQPAVVQAALRSFKGVNWNLAGKAKGGELYDALAHSFMPAKLPKDIRAAKKIADKEASLALLSRGVEGIKFLDQISRAAGDGTHNYVIFDENAIEVVEELEDRIQDLGFGEDGDQTQTPEFKAWFGKSKVVDAGGQPKVMYHATHVWESDGRKLGDFDAFDRMASVKIVGRPESFDTVGSFFSDRADREGAGMYGGSSGAIYPVYLSIKNPWMPRSFQAFIDVAHRLRGGEPGAAANVKNRGSMEPLREWLRANGHDGIMFPRGMMVDGDKQEIWVALEPTQIKSATGNSGAFDPSNPSIIASQRSTPVVRPERRAETAVIANNIQAIVTRLLGRKIRVEFSDTIGETTTSEWDREQRALAAGGDPLAATAGGQYSHNQAAPARSFLRLALADPLYDPTDSAYHEAWHHIETALTTQEERELLHRDILSASSGLKRLAREQLERGGFTDDVDSLPAYEITAIAFEGYARRKAAAQAIGPVHIGIRQFFNGIMELLERIRVMLGRRGIKTWEDVFEAAYRGDLAGRTPTSAWGEVIGAAKAIAEYGQMAQEGRDTFGMQDGTNPFDDGAAQARQATLNRQLSLRQPIDRALRIPFDLFGGMNRKGEWKPGLFLTDKAAKLLTSSKFSETGRFRFLNPLLHKVRAGLVDRYGLDPDYVERDRIRALDERGTLAQASDILDTLKKANVGPAEAKVLQAILTGEAVTDAQMEALAAPIRDAVDSLGQEAVDLGLLSAESFERNRGAYLHRVYMKNEADQNGLIRFVNRVRTGNRRRIIGSQFKGRGLWQETPAAVLITDRAGAPPVKGQLFRMLDLIDTDGQGQLPDVVKGKKDRVAARVYVPGDAPAPARYAEYQDRGVWEVRGFRNGNPILWRDYTKAEREQMGEITDARYTITKTFMQMAHDLATGRFYRDIAMNRSWAQAEEPAPGTWKDASEYSRYWEDETIEWVRVPETKIAKSNTLRYAALAGKFVRAEIWRDINELELLQRSTFWNTLLTEWKKNKTGRSPVTHMNNVMSNFIFMDMNDVGMADLVGAIRGLVTGDGAYREALDNGAFGADMVAQEMRDNILKPILKEIEAQSQGNTGTLSSKFGVLGKVFEKMWSAAKATDAAALRLYQLEDEVFRLALYNRRRRQGYPPREAALDARDTFLNYDIRAPWVNAARRSVLPFISYTYRAVPGIAKALVTHPWKLAKYAAIAYGMDALAYALLGLDDDDEDRERRSLRDEEQGYTWVGAPRMLRMPWSSDGNPVFLDIRRWIPAGDVFDLQQSQSAIALPSWLQLGGPLAIAAEILFNKSLFTGDPLVNTLTDDFWERAQSVGDYLWKAAMPGGPWIPGSWYWEKIVDSVTGARDWSGRPYDLASAIASAFGIKLKPQDVENGFALHAFAYEEVERALRAEANRIGRDMARNQISQAEGERQLAGVIADMENLNRRRLETFAP